jgi:integrase
MGVPGLRLRISATVATWNLAIRDSNGKPRRFSLGRYPALGLKEAREKARAEREKIRSGADPIAERRSRQEKAKKDSANSLLKLLDRYEQKVGAQKRSWPKAMRPAIEHVFKAALDRPLAQLTRTELQVIATDHPKAWGAATAVRSLRPVLRWASVNGYASEDLTRIEPPVKVQRRRRVLSREELGRLLPVLRSSTRPHAKLMLFLLYTLARRDEAASASWRDINFQAGTWAIPVTKNNEAHVVPLSQQAVTLLLSVRPDGAQPNDLVFRAPPRGKRPGGKLGNWDRNTRTFQKASGTSGWQRHDLRRTGATLLGEMGVMPDIIEAALNHVSIRSPLAATYNRSRYRPQVAAALQQLANYYEAILYDGEDAVPLRGIPSMTKAAISPPIPAAEPAPSPSESETIGGVLGEIARRPSPEMFARWMSPDAVRDAVEAALQTERRKGTEGTQILLDAAIQGSLHGLRKLGIEKSAEKRSRLANRRQEALRAVMPSLPGSFRKQPASIANIRQHVRPAIIKYFEARGEEPPRHMSDKTIQRDIAEILATPRLDNC